MSFTEHPQLIFFNFCFTSDATPSSHNSIITIESRSLAILKCPNTGARDEFICYKYFFWYPFFWVKSKRDKEKGGSEEETVDIQQIEKEKEIMRRDKTDNQADTEVDSEEVINSPEVGKDNKVNIECQKKWLQRFEQERKSVRHQANGISEKDL